MRGLIVIGAVLAAVGLTWPSALLVVRDETGAVRWRVPVTEGTPVVLQYTHSVYLAPTWEHFVVRSGRLALLDVSSTREAVLEYNRLAPPYRADGPRLVARISGVVLDVLPLRVGARGRPILTVGRVRVPLYEAGAGTGLRIAVRRQPRILSWLGGV